MTASAMRIQRAPPSSSNRWINFWTLRLNSELLQVVRWSFRCNVRRHSSRASSRPPSDCRRFSRPNHHFFLRFFSTVKSPSPNSPSNVSSIPMRTFLRQVPRANHLAAAQHTACSMLVRNSRTFPGHEKIHQGVHRLARYRLHALSFSSESSLMKNACARRNVRLAFAHGGM